MLFANFVFLFIGVKMKHNENLTCIYCKSSKVIRHGKTATGNRRYRCRSCGKTWVIEKAETIRPDIVSLTEAYLSGRTFRDLVEIYKSSPLRINKKSARIPRRLPELGRISGLMRSKTQCTVGLSCLSKFCCRNCIQS